MARPAMRRNGGGSAFFPGFGGAGNLLRRQVLRSLSIVHCSLLLTGSGAIFEPPPSEQARVFFFFLAVHVFHAAAKV